MGRITDALKKVGDERILQIKKKPEFQYVVRKAENTAIDEHVVAFHDPSSPAGEQYKILRTNVQSIKFEKNYKTFAITSSIHDEGKTISAINLAVTLAHDVNDKSILLIDADMRKGTVARYLGLNSHPGLSDVLKGDAEDDAVLINPNIENLTVMLSGRTPRNPSELLNSKKMEQLISSLKMRFDYIFIDTPPVMPLTDACIIGSMVDGVMVVVQAGRTQRDMVASVENRLRQARANTIGYIMTGVEHHVPRYLYRYVHEYSSYDNYYKDTAKDDKKKETKEVGCEV